MGPIEKMTADADALLAKGFRCIKIKIGHLAWNEELGLLQQLRARFAADLLEIRVDANGAYDKSSINPILAQLARLGLHSIEQPIAAGNAIDLKRLIAQSPIPIALDEELIGLRAIEDKVLYLKTIRPHYLVLKPTLIGGLETTRQWIAACKATGTKWWLTSSLETAVGLNALAQFVYPYKNSMPQGLSTGTIFKEKMSSPIYLDGANLRMQSLGK
jgi:L-alanine-DL-glutamate epimerase-like enolase superfamily enzyme